MKNKEFTIYNEMYTVLRGCISNDRLSLESYVYGEDYDSEKHYDFNRYETLKLFNKISFDDFIKLCQDKRLIGLEEFLKENNIYYNSFTI